MADNDVLNTGESIAPVEVVKDLPVEKSLLGATLGATAADEQEPDEEYETIPVKELLEVKLGRQGENDTQTVVIDCSVWLEKLPGCTLMIAATRPGEREIYLPEVTVSNGVVTWPILEQDTACAGTGRAEVRAMKDGKVKKSALFRTRVEPALEGDGSPDAPTPPNWVRLIIESVEASQAAAEHAEALIEEATACAINAVRFDEAQGLTDAQKATGRGNIDAASVAALQAQAAATAEALAGKVAVNQGSGNAGKALMIDPNGNVEPGEAGVSEAIKSALLACFQKVAWSVADGQDYYDALVHAFNGGVEPDPLPDTYQRVEYIKSTGTQSIHTGIKAYYSNDNANAARLYTYDIDMAFDEWQSGYVVNLVACFGDSAGFWLGYNNNIKKTCMGSNTGNAFDGAATQRYSYTWSMGSTQGQCIRSDGASISRARNISSEDGGEYELYLFGYTKHPDVGSDANMHFIGKIYGFSAYKSGVKIMELVPCYRKSDGEIGMYDIVCVKAKELEVACFIPLSIGLVMWKMR